MIEIKVEDSDAYSDILIQNTKQMKTFKGFNRLWIGNHVAKANSKTISLSNPQDICLY